MKKIITILFLVLSISTTSFAHNNFEVTTEPTFEKGETIVLNYIGASGTVEVDICNEFDCTLWKKTYDIEETEGKIAIDIPANNPLQQIILHVRNQESEKILKVNLTIPHEHDLEYHEFIRPTETDPGSLPYFYCAGCDKYFEDKAAQVEIKENIEDWKYLAPVPRDQWREGDPVPYIEQVDGENVTDPNKPNPSWTEEQIQEYKEYYEKEEKAIQEELNNQNKSIEQSTKQLEEVEQLEEPEKPVVFKSEKVAEPTLWEKIKMFFSKLFN